MPMEMVCIPKRKYAIHALYYIYIYSSLHYNIRLSYWQVKLMSKTDLHKLEESRNRIEIGDTDLELL